MSDPFLEAQRLHNAGQLVEAQALYAEVIEDNPTHEKALYLLGTVLAQRGRFEQAVAFLRRAIDENPENAVYHTNLGVARQNLGQLDRAKASFDRAIKDDPNNVDAYYNLAKLYRQLDLPYAALMTYEQVLSLAPERTDALVNMGNILDEEGRLDEALACFEQAVKINPKAGRAYINLGNLYRRMGEADKAVNAYDGLIRLRAHGGMRIKSATTLPVVYRDEAHLEEARAAFENRIWELLDDHNLTVVDPTLETSTTNFFLAYQNKNDKDLQQLTARLHLKSCPRLGTVAPHCEGDRKPGHIRLGLISAYFRRHSIGRMMIGLMRSLPRDDFEVVVITPRTTRDPLARDFQKLADETIYLGENFWEDQQKIAEAKLDVLFYADIGMDIRTYFMAFARLASVQCCTWGHPDTTGIPNMDCFLSSDWLEPEGAADHYSEELIRLPTLPTRYPFPDIPESLKDRTAFDLPENETLYLCPQSAIKHHPDLDQLFAGVLRGDDKGRVVLVDGAVSHWSVLLKERWAATIPDVQDRITIVPRQAPEDFIALQAAADVILDTPHFSGGNTSYESFALNKPIVTLDSAFMRGRVTAGLYRMMEMDDGIAARLDDYVEIALRLGKAPDAREDFAGRLSERNEALFDEAAVTAAFADFFRNTV